MNNPSIFVREIQITELLNNIKNPGDYLIGKAFSFDNNTVFHAFTKDNSLKSSPIFFPCIFQFVNPNDIKHPEEGLINELIGNNNLKKFENLILLSFSFENNKVIHNSFFINKNNRIVLDLKIIPKVGDIYSRSKSLIETDILKNKKVGIIGLGSGGSQIAVELAKAGVGNFYLYDFDRLELSNISRHICGIDDIGRYKTLAIKDVILNKNPTANIDTYEININDKLDIFTNSIKNVDLIICASDTTRSRFNVNQMSISNNITALFGRAITRAAGGDVLRVRPKIGPCLNCLFGQGIIGKEEEEYSQIRQVKQELPAYTSSDEIDAIIQVGLSTDILPISLMIVKLALVELSRGKESGISSLEDDLIADFYIWANRREKIYSNWPKMEYNFSKQTILRWYGAKVTRDNNCLVCSVNI